MIGRLRRVWPALALTGLLAACAAPQRIGGQGPAFERQGRFAVNLQTPDDLLALVWGHPMPVSGLRHWMRGEPAPGLVVDAQRDGRDRLTSLRQDGWDVRLSAYDDQGPGRVRLSRLDDQGQWRLQLIVDRP